MRQRRSYAIRGASSRSAPPSAADTVCVPGMSRATKRGKSGRSFTTKPQAISDAPSAKTTSPRSRIHCQNKVVP
jgi:hypothetical protein